MNRLLAVTVLLGLVNGHAALGDGVTFRVSVDAAAARGGEVNGRLVVSVIRPGSKLATDIDPNEAPYWDEEQPMFGVSVKNLAPGAIVRVDDAADRNLMAPGALKPGEYRAAARLIANRTRSSWREEEGNLFSEPVVFSIKPDGRAEVDLNLSRRTEAKSWPAKERAFGAELVEVRSALLSDFLKRDVWLRAGVVPPTGFKPGGTDRFAAVYEIPGFGGDHFGALTVARRRCGANRQAAAGDELELQKRTFWIVLDPESNNGHTLFADSENNGPRARALIEELIPELEKRYPLVARPEARLLRGHSSGGWSSLWLCLTHPETFGAVWSTSPDPIDFRRFQRVDIYQQDNMYRLQAGTGAADAPPAEETPSYRRDGLTVMTVRREARGEDVLGPDNTSAQQWDSWFAVFGPRKANACPADLFDPDTGAIDHAVAEKYRPYDIGHLLRSDPTRYSALFRANVRLVVGDMDNFFLNEAVALVKADLESMPASKAEADSPGYIKLVPGADHGTVFAAPEVRRFPGEMVRHLRTKLQGETPATP